MVAGGGAAGFFAAITAAEHFPGARVTLYERGPQFLAKVRISGGGRCNVTNACADLDEFSRHYPRGGRALRAPLRVFGPADTIAWFARRGVPLKTEPDGRVFPVTDSSQTIVDCLCRAARSAGVELISDCGVLAARRRGEKLFEVMLASGQTVRADRLMLATGGCRSAAAGALAVSLGHALEAPVTSLFSLAIEVPWLRDLAGLSVARVEVTVPGTGLRQDGPLLLTHSGLSGPAILKLSAWGARTLHDMNYRFPLQINWLPQHDAQALTEELRSRQVSQPARQVANCPLPPLPLRLWEKLLLQAGVARETRWAGFSHAARHRLIQQLQRTELPVSGKSLNRDEFVTCGGVRLREVNFQTMESRLCPGLFFGGELLDIDGLTGGFNFQAAWTTGWLAGRNIGK